MSPRYGGACVLLHEMKSRFRPGSFFFSLFRWSLMHDWDGSYNSSLVSHPVTLVMLALWFILTYLCRGNELSPERPGGCARCDRLCCSLCAQDMKNVVASVVMSIFHVVCIHKEDGGQSRRRNATRWRRYILTPPKLHFIREEVEWMETTTGFTNTWLKPAKLDML